MKHTLFRINSVGRLLTIILVAAGIVALSDEKPMDYTKGLAPEAKEIFEALEKDIPRMMESWKEARELQEEIKKKQVVFGIEARPAAERELKVLEANYSTAVGRFRSERNSFRDRASKEVAKKRDDIHRMRTRLGDNPTEAALNRLSEANAELNRMDQQIRALNSLDRTLSNVLAATPTTTTLLGFNPRDAESLKLAQKYETVVEARKRVKDAEVDLEALEKEPAGGMTITRKASIERHLEQAKTLLDREVEKVTRTQTRDIDRFSKQLERAEKQIADMEKFKRKVPDRLRNQEADLRRQIAALEKEVALVNKVAGKTPEAADKK